MKLALSMHMLRHAGLVALLTVAPAGQQASANDSAKLEQVRAADLRVATIG